MTTTHKSLSRRQMLLASGAAVAGAATAAFAADTGTPPITVSGLSHNGKRVDVIGTNDPAFLRQLDRLFPGLKNKSDFRAIQPLALLVTNPSSLPVKALTVQWQLQTTDGVHTTTRRFYPRANHRFPMTCQRRLIRPGETRLVTPFFQWNAARGRRNPIRRLKGIIRRSEPYKLLLNRLGAASSVTIALDSAVFSDWTSIGPDTEKLARHVAIRRDAEHDEAVSVMKRIKSNATRGDLVEMLRTHREAPEGVAGRELTADEPHKVWYFQARRIHARLLLRHLKKSDKTQFVQLLSTVIRQPKTIPNIETHA